MVVEGADGERHLRPARLLRGGHTTVQWKQARLTKILTFFALFQALRNTIILAKIGSSNKVDAYEEMHQLAWTECLLVPMSHQGP